MQAIFQSTGIVGTGAMGRGIAQMAAQAGSTVLLHDTQPGAAEAARAALEKTWQTLVTKGKLPAAEAQACLARVQPAASLAALSGCDLVVEAIVERLDVKRALFAELEAIVSPQAVLASNTSSLSVTAIAAALRHPQRLAGYHFFNPVPLMRVVEVIAGLKTDPVVCQQLTAYAHQFGHTPVSAQDTPGFIVNHAGRGYGTEALRVVGERVADFATIDRILKDQMGFRLGPFELMDLTALDVSHPVMESIYHQYFEEPRYRPSVIRRNAWPVAWWARRWGTVFTPTRTGRPRCRRSRRFPTWDRCHRSGCRPRRLGAQSSTSCSRTWAPASRRVRRHPVPR
jgi:3-hydroxybutyryl-CoA dehydrogenase